MLTGETINVNMKYWADITNGNILIMRHYTPGKGWASNYWINDKFISGHNDFSKDTVLFYGGFCYSGLGNWTSLRKSFAGGAYVGYSWSVGAPYHRDWAVNLIYTMSDTTCNPLPDIADWMKDPAEPKFYTYEGETVTVNFTGDSTLTLLPDTSTTIRDIDGNVYHTKKIGTQRWTVENLKTTRLNDGTAIDLTTDDNAWNSENWWAYCFYDNNASFKSDYGALYNWAAVSSGKLAPKGWHIPSLDEWRTLISFLGGVDVAGGKLKEKCLAHWASPNTDATNSSGFTGLPGGYRFTGGQFVNRGSWGYWWTSTGFDDGNAFLSFLRKDQAACDTEPFLKLSGFSVRCVKDQ